MRLRYYTTARGERPVAAYIEGLSRADQAVIAVALTEIAQRRMREVLGCRNDAKQ
jgi:hypothetical protein